MLPRLNRLQGQGPALLLALQSAGAATSGRLGKGLSPTAMFSVLGMVWSACSPFIERREFACAQTLLYIIL